jgi:serine/threonine protein kinase
MGILSEGQNIRDTYEVERFLGEGAFAEVFRVRHRFLGRQAMKVFKAAGMTLSDIEDMLGEAIMLSKIGHPNIVRVFDANTVDTPKGLYGYFTMENVPGGSLEKFWQSHGTTFVPVETAVDLMKQVCRGLSVAHREQPPIVHPREPPGWRGRFCFRQTSPANTRRTHQLDDVPALSSVPKLGEFDRSWAEGLGGRHRLKLSLRHSFPPSFVVFEPAEQSLWMWHRLEDL